MIEHTYPTRRSKRARIAAKSDHKCWYCGCKLSDATRTHDHVIPRSEQGPSNEQNLVLACVSCNNEKRNLSLEDYRKECGGVKFFGESIMVLDASRDRCECDECKDRKEPVRNPSAGSPKPKNIAIPLDGHKQKYTNDPRRVTPHSGWGQKPK